MREIKFRAWDEDAGKFHLLDGTFNYPDPCYDKVQQFTGLKDKNGTEIYEGDIVNCSSGCPHVIEWTEVPTGAILGGGMPGFYFSGLNEGYAFLGSEEVIGNIYEHPELLKD